MNYIKKLELQNRARSAMIAAMEREINELRRYLQSEKFYQDRTVQAQDVLNRLDNIIYAATAVNEDAL